MIANFLKVLFIAIFCTICVFNSPAQENILIRSVSVISMKSPRIDEKRDVYLSGGKILKIEKTNAKNTPANYKIVDGAGKFLLPGLRDSHVHAWDASLFFPIFLANGITGIRDMGGVLEPYLEWREKAKNDTSFLMPKTFIGGMILNGAPSNAPFFLDVRTAEEGRRQVRELKKRGADFIKVYSLLSKEVYEAIADECRQQNMTFAGHVPFGVSVAEASENGQKSLEHLRGFSFAASRDEEKLRSELLRLAAPVQQADKFDFQIAKKAYDYEDDAALDSFDPKKLEKLAKILKKTDTFVSPTLVVLRGAWRRDDAAFRADKNLRYFPGYIQNLIVPAQPPTAEKIAADEKRFARDLEIVKILHRAGVKIIAGTDAPNPYVLPGFSLHDELELYVSSGAMSSFEALETATVNATKFTGAANDTGFIESGNIADLVLLDANPLENIANTRRISAVFLDGRFLPKEKLEQLKNY